MVRRLLRSMADVPQPRRSKPVSGGVRRPGRGLHSGRQGLPGLLVERLMPVHPRVPVPALLPATAFHPPAHCQRASLAERRSTGARWWCCPTCPSSTRRASTWRRCCAPCTPPSRASAAAPRTARPRSRWRRGARAAGACTGGAWVPARAGTQQAALPLPGPRPAALLTASLAVLPWFPAAARRWRSAPSRRPTWPSTAWRRRGAWASSAAWSWVRCWWLAAGLGARRLARLGAVHTPASRGLLYGPPRCHTRLLPTRAADELHMVSDGDRGIGLEMSLSKLLFSPAASHVQIVGMSATSA